MNSSASGELRKRIATIALTVTVLTAITGAFVSYLYAAFFVTPLYSASAVIRVSDGSRTSAFADVLLTDPDIAARMNGAAVTAEPVDDASHICITATCEDPFTAANTANLIARNASEIYQKHFGSGSVSITREADLPGRPSFPDRTQYLLNGTWIGLCAGAALALMISLLILSGNGKKRTA